MPVKREREVAAGRRRDELNLVLAAGHEGHVLPGEGAAELDVPRAACACDDEDIPNIDVQEAFQRGLYVSSGGVEVDRRRGLTIEGQLELPGGRRTL